MGGQQGAGDTYWCDDGMGWRWRLDDTGDVEGDDEESVGLLVEQCWLTITMEQIVIEDYEDLQLHSYIAK